MNSKSILLWAACSGLVVVALGAFGAHGLAATLGERLSTWNTAVLYQMFHTAALLVLGLLMSMQGAQRVWLRASALAFVLGILLFSGSLYLLALTGLGWLGMITPLGGLAFLAGWGLLAVAVVKRGEQA